jgi:hypothetical protein
MIQTIYSALRRVRPSRIVPAAMISMVTAVTILALGRPLTWFNSWQPMNSANTALKNAPTPPAIKAVRFVISRRGIEPAQLTIPAGRYWVAVDNEFDLDEIDLNIDRVNGPRVKNGKTRKGQLKFRDFVDFTPGQYVLSEKKHASRISRISVTNAQ